MSFIKIADGEIAAWPYDLLRLRRDHPDVSFPEIPDGDTLAAFGVFPVDLAGAPDVSVTQRIEELPPVFVDGAWRQQLAVVELPEDEAAEVLAAIDAARRAGVVAERGRRLSGGFDYDFGDARGVHHIGTTDQDMKGWDEVTKGATAAVALGAGASTFDIATETGDVTITAAEWLAILVAATAIRQPVFTASFALQRMTPVPEDFADDAWWP